MEGLILLLEALFQLVETLIWIVCILLFVGFVVLGFLFPIPILVLTVVGIVSYGIYFAIKSHHDM